MDDAFLKSARNARDRYIDDLTDVAWKALEDVGFRSPHGGYTWQGIRDVIAGHLHNAT